jgi:hypothetical protein
MTQLFLLSSVGRVLTAALVSTLVLAVLPSWSNANTLDQAPVSISVVNDGALEIAWMGGAAGFLVNGEIPTLVAGTPEVVATATFELNITDTRPVATRTGYVVAISAREFAAANDSTTVTPSMLSIQSISGLPAGYVAEAAIGARLDSPVTILTVPNGAGAVDATISITIAMTITPGIMEGSYVGNITADILPIPVNAS